MNVLIYKKTTPGTITLYSTTDRSPITLEIEIILKMPLINGVKLIGDCIVYRGGGNEFIGTIDHITDESNAGNYPIKIYQEFDQSNWDYNTDVFKNDLGTFSFETKYKQLGDTVYNLQGQGFCKRRMPYTNFSIESGGSDGAGECCYIWSGYQWGTKVLNRRSRLGLRIGFTAASGSYGIRSGLYNTTLDLSGSTISGNMQIRMKV